MVGYLKVLQGVWSTAGKVIDKIKDRKTAKVEKRIADAMADKERINSFGSGSSAGSSLKPSGSAMLGGDSIKASSRSLIGSAGGASEMVTKAESRGALLIAGKKKPSLILVIGGIILAFVSIMFLSKKRR